MKNKTKTIALANKTSLKKCAPAITLLKATITTINTTDRLKNKLFLLNQDFFKANGR
jgi:hypothetical protein